MKALKKYWKLAVPVLAVLAVFFLIAAVLRALSIVREEKYGSGGIVTHRTLSTIWLELSQLFKLSRY